jgi:gas vesicle protein
MTQQNPDEIRADIERTRNALSNDVDAMAEKVTPSKVAHRQADKVRDAVGGVKDRIMGSAEDTGAQLSGHASHAKDSLRSAAGGASDAAQQAPQQLKRKTQGNPLAAGVIALGVGWLAASLLPATGKEQQLVSRLEEKAQPVLEDVKDQARSVAEELKEPAQQAAQTVKDSATDSVETVKSEGQAQKDDVVDSAKGSADDVRHS